MSQKMSSFRCKLHNGVYLRDVVALLPPTTFTNDVHFITLELTIRQCQSYRE